MSKERRGTDDSQQRQQKTEAVLDVLEAAIEFDLDATPIAELPDSLRDPIKAFAHGCELLEQGLSFHSSERSEFTSSDDDEFRMAARNGRTIPEHIKLRMRAERERIEAQMLLEFDESP